MNTRTADSEMEARKDTYTSLLVTIALGLPKEQQARYMAANGVPFYVAKRVLTRGKYRR